MRAFIRVLCLLLGLGGFAAAAVAQELVPRRWTHLPVDTNIGGVAFGYTSGDIFFDPAMRIEDARFDIRTYGLKYIHSFEAFGKSARFDLVQTYQNGTWKGLLEGVPTTVRREGWGDTVLRCSVLLLGSPPLSGQEYLAYHRGKTSETVVGAGLIVKVPTGEYYSDKLINLGSNRFTIRPQIGIVHRRGKWAFELTSEVWLYTDNNDFYGGTRLEQEPSFSFDAHVVYTVRPGIWLAAGGACLLGEATWVGGVPNFDSKKNYGWGIGLGVALSRSLGLKLTYAGIHTGVDTGTDTNSVLTGLSLMW